MAVAAVSLVLVFFNPHGFFNPVRSVFFIVFSPFQKVAYGLAFEISEIKNFVSSIGQLKKENENLVRENRELLAERSRLEEAGRENEILRQELKLLPKEKLDLEGAAVVGRDFYGQGDWIEIDKGSRDGIEKEMPVIVNSGILIGKVGEVHPTVSRVDLVSNTGSVVNVVSSKNDTKGVVKGEYGTGIIMDMVLQSDPITQGDEIITSGVGGGFPRGLVIGKVQEIGSSGDKLFKKAIVSSPVDFSRLQFVFIVK